MNTTIEDSPNRGTAMGLHRQLAQIWASVIGIDVNEIRASDNFFDLGGDSLLVLRAIQQTEQALGYRVDPRRYLFENLGQIALSANAAPDHADLPDLGTLPLGHLKGAAHGEGLLSRAFGSWLRKG